MKIAIINEARSMETLTSEFETERSRAEQNIELKIKVQTNERIMALDTW